MPATPHTALDPDLYDLAELLPDLPVAILITAPRQWPDDCGYCPGPEDTVTAVPREGLALIAYEAPDMFDPTRPDWTLKDPVCSGCLPVALAQTMRRRSRVWIEVPSAQLCQCLRPKVSCVCAPAGVDHFAHRTDMVSPGFTRQMLADIPSDEAW